MRPWARALIVPLIAAALWLVPSDRPTTEVAGAVAIATLADAAPTTAAATSADSVVQSNEVAATTAQSTTTEPATTTPPTTLAVVTSTTVSLNTTSTPAAVSSTDTAAPTTAAESTTSTPTAGAAAPTPTTVAPTTAAPTTAAPVTTVSSASLGEQALQRVAFDWQTAFPNWRVEFLGPRNGIRALTYPAEKRIEIFVRSSDTAATLHRVFAHELGHVVDVERNSQADRDRWLAQRGLSSSTRWWPNAESPDFATGAGDFAEAFAVWETGVTTRSTLAGQPTRADLDLLRELSQG